MIQIITAQTPAHYEAAKILFEEYAEALGIDLCFQNFERELQNITKLYGQPEGELFLVLDNGQFVGCAALKKHDEQSCELKRVYIRPAYRGLKIGEGLTIKVLETGRKLGYKYIKLDSLRRLEAAIGLYKKYGFEEIEPYNFNPEADVVYFERKL